MSHSLARNLLCLVMLASASLSEAQEVVVDATFQTLALSTTPSGIADELCARNFQTLAPGAGTVIDAGDYWMECPSFIVALPELCSLTTNNTSGQATISGVYTSLNVESVDGTLTIQDSTATSGQVTCTNNSCSLSRTVIRGGSINGTNDPVYLDDVILGTQIELVNSNLVGRAVRFAEGTRIRIHGTNSDVRLRGVKCTVAGGTLADQPYRTTIRSNLKRRVNRLRGRVDLYRTVRPGQLKRCASIMVNLTIGSFSIR